YSPRLHAFLRGCLQYSPSERLACVDLALLLVGLPDSAVALDSGHSRTLSQSHQRASKRERSGILSCEDGGFGQPSGPSKRRRSACLVSGRLATTPLAPIKQQQQQPADRRCIYGVFTWLHLVCAADVADSLTIHLWDISDP
ncbi:Cyclin-dependent kinase-like, partial [Perkinsus olseni]